MDFLPLPQIQVEQPLPPTRNSHTRYYQSFRHPLFIRQSHPINSIHFAPNKPHRFAITSSSRVLIYAPKTGKVLKTITRFKETARGAEIRKDGKLMVAGGDDGIVQVFDLGSRAILRTMKAHEQPVHQTRFSPDNTHILSASDDATLRLWDIPSQTSIHTFTGHGDYVRSCAFSSSNPNLFLSGSYDSTCKLWDARTGEAEMTLQHGGNVPVEDVLVFPSAGAQGSNGGANVALSCGGPILRAWDLTMARCIRALSNHQKTITCMTFEGDGRKRVLTGGLDMMVKVYDVENWKVVHSMRYPAPILSLAVSPDDTHIAAGMTDGTLSLRRRDVKSSEVADKEAQNEALRSGAYEYFADFEKVFEGGLLGPKGRVAKKAQKNVLKAEDEVKVEGLRRKRLQPYDKYLKGFKYGAALDAVMVNGTKPLIAFSLIQELIFRDGLRTALSSRDDVTLQPILSFLAKNIVDSRFGGMAAEVMDVLLDIYGDVLGQSPLIDDLIRRMQDKVRGELRFQQQLVSLNGALEMVLAQSALSQSA